MLSGRRVSDRTFWGRLRCCEYLDYMRTSFAVADFQCRCAYEEEHSEQWAVAARMGYLVAGGSIGSDGGSAR